MKVIFLGVDGVLNNLKWLKETEGASGSTVFLGNILENRSLALLRKIVRETGAVIVLSSSWRNIPDCLNSLRCQLAQHSMSIMDITPSRPHMSRAQEIALWLAAHPEAEQYCVLDRSCMNGMHLGKCVQTTFESGLHYRHVREAVRILRPLRSGDLTALPFYRKETALAVM